jgi:hypothetical protein
VRYYVVFRHERHEEFVRGLRNLLIWAGTTVAFGAMLWLMEKQG